MVENIEDILTIEGLWISSYLLKLKEKPKVSIGYRFGLILTHNPKAVGSNPAPATKNIKGLFRASGVTPLQFCRFIATLSSWPLILNLVETTPALKGSFQGPKSHFKPDFGLIFHAF